MEKFYCVSGMEGFDHCEKQCGGCLKRSKTFKGESLKNYKSSRSKQKGIETIIMSLRIDPRLKARLELIGKFDNRSLTNTINTMLRNQIGELDYDFSEAIELSKKS